MYVILSNRTYSCQILSNPILSYLIQSCPFYVILPDPTFSSIKKTLYSFCIYTAIFNFHLWKSTAFHLIWPNSLRRTVFVDPWLFFESFVGRRSMRSWALRTVLSELGIFPTEKSTPNEPKLFACCYLILYVRDFFKEEFPDILTYMFLFFLSL